MKKVRRFAIVTMIVFVIVFGVFATGMTKVEAATKTYSFSSCNVKKFKKSGNKLIIKLKKSTFQVNDSETAITSLKFKISKKCKWYNECYDRSNGEYTESRTKYKSVRKSIMFDRSYFKKTGYYNNMGMSSIKVKNAKIVSVTYFAM